MNNITDINPTCIELDYFINDFTKTDLNGFFNKMSDKELKEYFEDLQADNVINQYKSFLL